MRTVVLSGSLGATGEMWDAQAEALRGFDVVRVEHPGHGGAPMEDVRDVRALARRVLDLVQVERFLFVGLSLGGAVAMHVAFEAPERVERLVLAATSPRFGTAETWDERIALVRSGGMEAVADAVLPRWFTPAFRDVQRFRAMLVATPPDVYVRYCEILREYDVRGRLDEITVPTLAIAGAEDPTSPPEHLEAIAAGIADAHVVVIPNGAHLLNVERANEFNDALLAHLA
jgi:3-oxoadipate enol-lactonase